jgi:hypothetical protein
MIVIWSFRDCLAAKQFNQNSNIILWEEFYFENYKINDATSKQMGCV